MINSIYLPSKIKELFKLDEKELKIAKNEMKKFIDNVFTTAKKEFYEMGFILLFFQNLICKNNDIKFIVTTCTGKNIFNFLTYTNEFKIFFLISSLLVGKYHDDNSMLNIDYVAIGRRLNLRFFNLKMINQYEMNLLEILNYYLSNNFTEFEALCFFYLKETLIK